MQALLAELKSMEWVLRYAQAYAENGWSRTVLEWQIKLCFHKRGGQVMSNFALTLHAPQSELVQQSLNDPYMFDFLTIEPRAVELTALFQDHESKANE